MINRLKKCTRFLGILLLVFIRPLWAEEEEIPFEIAGSADVVTVAESEARFDYTLLIRMPEDHFLYKDKTHFKADDERGVVEWTGVEWPPTVMREDPFFKKKIEVWQDEEFSIPLHFEVKDRAQLPTTVTGAITIQGCSQDVCFRPITQPFIFKVVVAGTISAPEAPPEAPEKAISDTPPTRTSWIPSSERLGELFAGNLSVGLAIAFIGGVLTDFTPCVLPIIPLILLFIGVQQKGSRRRNVMASGALVLGMSTMYVGLGLLAVALGWNLGFVFQSLGFLAALAIFFFIMALALWDVVSLALPPRLQTTLSNIGGRGLRGSYVVGLTVGLVALPCVGPIAGALLLYVAGTHDWVKGALYLLVYGLGMGSLFIVTSLFYGKWRGLFTHSRWTVWVKKVLGVVFLLLSLYYGTILANGLWHRYYADSAKSENDQEGIWYLSFAKAQALAKERSLPIVVDLRADWCLPCLEMEQTTFADTRIQELLKEHAIPVRIDCTQLTDECESLSRRYGVVGYPTMLFLDADGKRLDGFPLQQGYVDADTLARRLKQLSLKNSH